MSGVFLSYSRGDRALAERVVRGLRRIGVEVWWDEDMPGVDWQDELSRQIQQLAAVLVIWSPLSSASKNVRDEARLGQNTEKLVNALSGVAQPPFPFDRANGLPLDGWAGRGPHRGWTRLIQTIEERLVAAGVAKRGEVMAAQAEYEAAIHARGERVSLAEHAFKAAKAGEEAAAEATAAASASLETAEELLRLVVDRRASGPVLRASQSDVETARDGLAAATAQKSAAAKALAEASLGLSRARADLEQLFDAAPPIGPPPEGPAATPSPVRDAEPSTPQDDTAARTGPRQAGLRAGARRMPLWASAGGIAAVALLGGWLLLGQHKAPAAAAAGALARVPTRAPTPGPAAAAAPTDPVAAAASALAGDWSGNGAACWSNPLRIAVVGRTLREILSTTPSVGAITGPAGGRAVRVRFPGDADVRGDQVYAVAGDTLTVTLSGGSMSYQRCRN